MVPVISPPPVTTDAEGHAAYELLPHLETPPGKPYEYPTALLLAASSTDSTFTAIHPYDKTLRTASARWYVTDDRFTYKPGVEIYIGPEARARLESKAVHIVENQIVPGGLS